MNTTPRQPDEQPPAATARLVGTDRVLVVLTELAQHPDGVSLDDLSRGVDSAKSTVHRALSSLRRAGFARQDARGHYVLGDTFLKLAFAHHEMRQEHVRVRPALERLAHLFGETVHYAVLEGREVVYRAKVDAPVGAVQLTSTVGGRNPAHSTAVGKALLAHALPDDAAVREWAAAGELPACTQHTITDAEELVSALATARRQGFASEDQENEEGVNCVAVPVWLTSPTTPSGAISISGLAYRSPVATLVASVQQIREIVASVSGDAGPG